MPKGPETNQTDNTALPYQPSAVGHQKLHPNSFFPVSTQIYCTLPPQTLPTRVLNSHVPPTSPLGHIKPRCNHARARGIRFPTFHHTTRALHVAWTASQPSMVWFGIYGFAIYVTTTHLLLPDPEPPAGSKPQETQSQPPETLLCHGRFD